MKLFKQTLAAVAVMAAFAGAAQASTINVGGVVWDPDSLQDFSGTSAVLTQKIDALTGVLSGFGVITTLNGTGASVFCPGCELTIQYGGYTPVGGAALPPAGGVGQQIYYTGGWLNIYVDTHMDASPSDPLLLNAANTGNGQLWASLVGHAISTGVTLTGYNFSSSDILAGAGLFDVTGGLARGNLDTNTKADGSDVSFSTSFTSLYYTDLGGLQVPLFATGSGNFKGNSIPEPASLALVGMGLLGAGALRRRQAGK